MKRLSWRRRVSVASVFTRLQFVCGLLMAIGVSAPTSGMDAITPADAKVAVRQQVTQPDNSTSTIKFGRGYRFNRDGWIYIHLEGGPRDIGLQHGYLLATEIADAFNAIRMETVHESRRDWDFYREAAEKMLWPRIDPEYQSELQGIVEGLEKRGVKLDVWDIVAFNAFAELPDYYVPWLDNELDVLEPRGRGRCSAFIATGSWTKDNQIVMAHNNWASYIEGAHWNIIFDILPRKGYRILMDGFPGGIASSDDFGINSAGMMITETTIENFHGWNPDGKPEFMRARKAMQYAASIDDFVTIMLDGNNGGYANDWLLGDRKTNEIARFELGLKHHRVWRATDGYFSGANFPSDPQLICDETTFKTQAAGSSPNTRRVRWDELMAEHMGKIDTTVAQALLADHYDAYAKKDGPNRRTICGHGDLEPQTLPNSNSPPYEPWGAVNGKVVDGNMTRSMEFVARFGRPCGDKFDAAQFLDDHPQYSWQAPILQDLVSGPWARFRIGDRARNNPDVAQKSRAKRRQRLKAG